MEDNGHRVVVIIDDGYNPMELWVLGALLLSGILFIAGLTPRPQSVQETLPEWSRWLWNVEVLAGSALTLISIYFLRKFQIVQRKLMITGYVLVSTAAIIYGSCIFYFGGLVGSGAGILFLSIGFAAIVRINQLRRELNKILQNWEKNE